MSKLEKVLPSNLQFLNSDHDLYTLEVGNSTKNTFSYDSASHSANSTVWNFTPPSGGVVMNRRIVLKVQFTATVDTSFGTAFAPRQWAPMSAARSVELTLNGQKSSSLPSELLHALGRFNTSADQRAKFMSGFPSQPDCGYYDDWPQYTVSAQVTNQGVPGGAVTRISIPNTRSPFASELCSNEVSRAWEGYYTQAGAVRTYTLYAPVFCSPLSWNTSSDGLANIGKVNLRIDWENNLLNHLFSYSDIDTGLNVANDGNVVIDWNATKPQIIVEFANPLVEIPPLLAFDHIELQQDVKEIAQTASGAALVNTYGQAQVCDKVPDCIYIFVRKRLSTMTVADANVYAGITRLLVRFNNNDYNFSLEQMSNVWQMSVNNGLDVPWSSWNPVSLTQKNKVGSIVCLQFGKDIPLPAGVFPSSPIQSTVQVYVEGRNYSSADIDFDLYTVISYNARYLLEPNSANVIRGITTDEQSMLKDAPIGQGESHNPHEIVGGAMLGRNHKFLRKMTAVGRHLFEQRAQIKGAANAARDAVGMARNVVHGAAQAYQAGSLVGGSMVGGGARYY